MNRFNRLVYFVVVLLFCSCNKPFYNYETKEVDFINHIDSQIKGANLDIAPLGLNNIIIFDSLLIIPTNNPTGQLKVYSLNTKKRIANLCKEGRAMNEFLQLSDITDQIYKNKEGHIILPLIDNLTSIKEVDVTESINKQQTIVVSKNNCRDMFLGSFVLLNNNPKHRFEITDAVRDKIRKDVCIPIEYNIISPDSNITTLNVFPKQMKAEEDVNDIINAYWSVIFKHPSRNLVIQPFNNMDYILFFDFDKGQYFAVHQIGATSFSDKAPHFSRNSPHTSHFGDVAFFDNGFFILYYAGGKAIYDDDKKCPDLLLFDLEGNYLHGFHMENFINRIEYDEHNKMLIGADVTKEKLYSFDFKNYKI